MNKIDNYSFYHKAYLNHGVSAKGLKWSSKERQFIRFETIFSFLKEDIKDSSILDVGCGYGDLINFLKENSKKNIDYLGVDCEDFILKIAQERFPENNFLKVDILKDEIPKCDYLVLSGTLNILQKDDFLKAIENCFNACKKGFVFNFLTKSYVQGLTSFDIYLYVKTLCEEIEIKDKYLDNDFTIFMKKN